MKIQTILRFMVVSIIFSTITFLSGCEKTGVELIDSQNDLPRNSEPSNSYQYSKTIRLEDGEYYVNLTVSSASGDLLGSYIAQEPAISVFESSKLNIIYNTGELEYDSSGTNHSVRSDGGLILNYTDSNVPHGYTMKTFVKKPIKKKGSINGKVAAESQYSYQASDDLAKGANTTVFGPYSLKVNYYSKGCCWYSVGWYNRGYITHYGPNYSHDFNAMAYSPYKGAKYDFYTTPTIASSFYWYFTRWKYLI